MPHTYRFADAARTTVMRDDGATFPWQKGAEPGAVGAALGGFIGEDYRMDGCPMPTDNVKAVAAAEPHTLLKVKLGESNTGDVMPRRRRKQMQTVTRLKAKAKLKAKPKAKAKAKPPGKRKYR